MSTAHPNRGGLRPTGRLAALALSALLIGIVAACDAGPGQGGAGSPSGGSAIPSPVRSPSTSSPGRAAETGSPPPSAAPTPAPSAVAYVVVAGDTLTSIARRFATTPRSIALWNGVAYGSLDPYSPSYDPNRIDVGWTLSIVPGVVVDEEDPPSASSSTAPSPAPSVTIGPAATPDAGGASVLVSTGPRESTAVALTFDMGGRLDPAVAIVDWLIANGVRATVFPTGRTASETAVGRAVMGLVAARPDLFSVGNHSWDHPDLTTLTDARVADQLTRTETAVEAAAGVTTKPFFRPPYGAQDAALRAAVGAAGWAYTVMWDVDTIDWRPTADGGPTADDITAKVLSRARGGSIVLMHLGGYHTLEALPAIVAELRLRGLEPVTLAELLGR